jgi:hypothetical protein
MALYPIMLDGELFRNEQPSVISEGEIPMALRPVIASEEVITDTTDDVDNNVPDDVQDTVDD